MTLHVAFVTDRTYLPWCATALLSCADAHPAGGVRAHVVHDGTLTADDVDDLQAMAPSLAVAVHEADPELVRHLPALDRFGRVVWLRFLLPELLPEVDRVLYLDADTLVTAPLLELAELDLGGAPVAAVLNVMHPDDRTRLGTVGLDPAGFFNSGVLLLDLAQLRREGFIEQVAAAVESLGDQMLWPDQDVLNLVFADRWHRLHPRFNAQNSVFDWPTVADRALGPDERRRAVNDPAVVHFEGPYVCKPWHLLSNHLWRDRYRATLARTPWAEVSLDDDSWVTRSIHRLPRAWQLPIYEQVVRSRGGRRPSVRGAWQRYRAGEPR